MKRDSRAKTIGTMMSRLLVLCITIISCGTDTPLGEYVPSSDQEAAVKTVLLDFQNAVNRRDAGKVADLLHEEATLILGRERKRHTKSEYIKILPRRLADQPPIALGKPKMDMQGDSADVRIYMTRGDSRALVTFHLNRDNHRWTISGWTY